MGVIERLLSIAAPKAAEPPSPEQEEARSLLATLHAQVDRQSHRWDYRFKEELAAILGASREVQAQVLLELLASRKRWGRDASWERQRPAHELLNILFRRALPLDEPMLVIATERFAGNRPYHASEASFVGLIERCLPDGATEPAMIEALDAFEESIGQEFNGYGSQQNRNVRRRLSALRGHGIPDGLEPGEAWTDAVLGQLQEMPEEIRHVWQAILDHAGTARSSRPSEKWRREAAKRCETIRELHPTDAERDPLVDALAAWFSKVVKPKELDTIPGEWGYVHKPPISDRNAVFLRGLVWTASTIDSATMLASVARLAEVCFRKIPEFGAVNKKVGNACVWALGNSPSLEGVAWLARLHNSVRYASAKKLIVKATQDAAERAGMTAQDIEEVALPDFGLGSDGVRRQSFGDWTASLALLPDDKTAITWHRAATDTVKAKKQKSVPAQIKAEFAAEIKELRAEAKALQKLLPGQRSRFERFYLDQREWPLESWRERYLDHPFAAHLAKRLIWRFEAAGVAVLGCWLDEVLVDVTGSPLTLDAAARVTLWHPLSSEPEVVLAWRGFLEEQGITQPFKQAHREVYILTDAELQTGVYSNRFAAHILQQHQLASLLATRGWSYRLQGGWDSHNVPCRELEHYDLVAEYWLDAIATEEMTPAGIFVYVSSDQLCFRRPEDHERLALSEVPALVFSEVMRDLDLFVSVSSIGADPTWSDDRRQEFTQYWTSFAFGELRASGEARRESLERLLPSLKAAEKLAIDGRWLTVDGKLHRYRIHLGSGSIQREPGGHVCIVPARGPSAGKLQLPFEGDSLLSIIISKALMLVHDDKIEDQTIRHQIR